MNNFWNFHPKGTKMKDRYLYKKMAPFPVKSTNIVKNKCFGILAKSTSKRVLNIAKIVICSTFVLQRSHYYRSFS